MATTAGSNTMLNYFTKLPAKACIPETENSRKSAPVFNKQHVLEFQTRIDKFESELFCSSTTDQPTSYIKSIKTGELKPFILKRKARGPLRAKLLQYHEDVRPPYFGTWQKKSKRVTGRRPFGKDDEVFDYDVDSEAEWDIGGPGESLKGDDSEDDEDGLDDYEIDMKTFVPHGYVSDDEINVASDNEDNQTNPNNSIEEDCDQPKVDQDDNSSSSVKIISETKARHAAEQQQNHPQHQQQQAPQKQTPRLELKPIAIGINYEDNPITSESKIQFLNAFRGVSCG